MTVDILKDPSSPEVCLLLYIYSIEPPFYADLNRACRNVDESKFIDLGPFARAMFEILSWAYVSEKRRDDRLR